MDTMLRSPLRVLAFSLCLSLSFSVAAAEDLVETDFRPDQSTLPVDAPDGAVVLFDGKDNHQFVSMSGQEINWPIDEGSLQSTRGNSRANHLVSKLHFRDADLHIEFRVSEKKDGNSGIYIHGNYELQILNSHGAKKLTQKEEGAVYGFGAPLVNAARPAGEWQVYDIRYRAPRRNAQEEIVDEGHITAWLNGKLVQNDLRVGEPRSKYHPYRHGTTPYLQTIWAKQKRDMTGPVFLQDHDSPAQFRNVWVKPLDDKAGIYEPMPAQH